MLNFWPTYAVIVGMSPGGEHDPIPQLSLDGNEPEPWVRPENFAEIVEFSERPALRIASTILEHGPSKLF